MRLIGAYELMNSERSRFCIKTCEGIKGFFIRRSDFIKNILENEDFEAIVSILKK